MAGGLAFDAGWLLLVVLVAGLLAAIGIATRRTLLEHGGGSVECGLRRDPDQNWQLGLAVYQPDELRWYNAFGVRMRPGEVFARTALLIVSRRPAGPEEVARLGTDVVVIECKVGGSVSSDRLGRRPPPGDLGAGRADGMIGGAAAAGAAGPVRPSGADEAGADGTRPAGNGPGGPDLVELAMSEAALTGFLAWLEAAPPSDLPGFNYPA